MKKTVYIATLLSITLFSCSKNTQEQAETEPEENETHLVLTPEQIKTNGIKFGKVENRYIDSKITVSGVIHALPQNKASVHSQLDGFVDKVNFITGQHVQKGQVLATIRNPSFIALQKQFLESYFNMNLNYKDYQRKKALLAGDAVSQKTYEQAQALYQVSSAEYESLKSELELLGFRAGSIISTRKISPVLPIISPQSGFIQADEISPGKQITTDDELFLIINQKELHIELNVPSKYASDLFVGQPVEFMLPEVKDTLKGSVHLIGKVTNTDNNTIQIHADIESKLPPANFYEGRFVNATISNKTQALPTVPKEAVFEEEGRKYVFIKKGNQVERKEVQTGVSNNDFIELINFNANQEIVTSGVYYLKANGEIGHGH
ncbi:MAG: efflux RND transporter periplasmic adaptor subunit [Flavobacteriaceae bacterium]|jgi:cobalt-zinc-cadmium efflux system membrane fusion protein|nr:efflux RND transporter periplasmic adaptor subunit [Flavobacteriaceae bacterium]